MHTGYPGSMGFFYFNRPAWGESENKMAEETATATENAGPSLSERIMAYAGSPESQHMPVATQDAAASEADAADADQQGNQGDAAAGTDGLDTTSGEEGSGADQGEGEDGGADNPNEKGKEEVTGTKQRTLEERAAEIAAKIVADKLAERDKEAEQARPDFAPPEVVAKVKQNIVKSTARMRELEAEIEVAGDDIDPAKMDEYFAIEEFISGAKAALREDATKRTAWEQRQTAKKTQGESTAVQRQELDKVAELYRQELKVDPATWQKMGQWFESQLPSNPLVVEEFNDILSRQGKVAAIRFAHDWTTKHMGQGTKQANEKKEQTKNKAAALTATTTGKAAPIDLSKARKEFADNPTPEAFEKLQALKRQARGA